MNVECHLGLKLTIYFVLSFSRSLSSKTSNRAPYVILSLILSYCLKTSTERPMFLHGILCQITATTINPTTKVPHEANYDIPRETQWI